jgi:hypothetical protein
VAGRPGAVDHRDGLGSRNPAIVGSAEEVSDDLIAWVEKPISTASI